MPKGFFSTSGTMFQTIKRVSLVAFFGIGKVFSSTGQLVFGILSALKYLKVTNKTAVYAIAITGGTSTAYVRALTRFPALWRQFAPGPKKSKEGLSLWPNSHARRCAIVVVGGIGVLSGVVDALQAYLGSDTILGIAKVEDKYIIYVTGSYILISSIVTYYAFTVSNTIENTVLLLEQASPSSGNRQVRDKKIIGDLFKTCVVSIFGATAFGTFAYFTIGAILPILFPELPAHLIQAFSAISLVTTLAAITLSRVAETYKYFNSSQTLSLHDLNTKQKVILIPHLIMGPLDVLTFALSFHIGCVVTLADIGADEESMAVKLLSIIPAISGGFLHYIFSVRPIIKTAIEDLKKPAAERNDEIKNQNVSINTPLIKDVENRKQNEYGQASLWKKFNSICCDDKDKAANKQTNEESPLLLESGEENKTQSNSYKTISDYSMQ